MVLLLNSAENISIVYQAIALAILHSVHHITSKTSDIYSISRLRSRRGLVMPSVRADLYHDSSTLNHRCALSSSLGDSYQSGFDFRLIWLDQYSYTQRVKAGGVLDLPVTCLVLPGLLSFYFAFSFHLLIPSETDRSLFQSAF